MQIKGLNFKYLLYFLIIFVFLILLNSYFRFNESGDLLNLDKESVNDVLINVDENFISNSKKEFRRIVLESDPKNAINILKKDSQNDNKALSICHDILHEIGHTAFYKYKNLTDVLLFQDDFCNSGYLHGVFEEYFDIVDNPLEGLSKICDQNSKRKFDEWQCYHGIGHGFMYFTGGDLDKSLDLCKDVLNRESNRNYCYNGVYMEIFNTQILAKEINFVDKNNPSLICLNRNIDKNSCYFYLPTYFSQTLNTPYINIFEKCEQLNESKYKKSCISGIGSEAFKRNTNKVKDVFDLCENADGYFNEVACVYGMVGISINQNASIEAGEKLCQKSSIKYRFLCNQKINKFNYLFE